MIKVNIIANIKNHFESKLECFNRLQTVLGFTKKDSVFYLENKDGFIKSIQPIYPPPSQIVIPVGQSIDIKISNDMFSPLETEYKEFYLDRLLPNNEALYCEL